jgi:hypothetical protein
MNFNLVKIVYPSITLLKAHQSTEAAFQKPVQEQQGSPCPAVGSIFQAPTVNSTICQNQLTNLKSGRCSLFGT